MASNLSCVGLAVDDNRALGSLVDAVRHQATSLGHADGVEVLRWEDRSSGARLLLGTQAGKLVDLLPSLASGTTTHLARIRAVNEDVATAAVVDEAGEQLTSAALEIEQRRFLGAREVECADAAIVALGQSISIHKDADAYAESADSLLDPLADEPSEPPAHYAEKGWKWPPRIATESFISHGVFGDPKESRATARLSGTVLSAERRTTAQTGQAFLVARVRTIGFEVDLCLNANEHPDLPAAGHVVSGIVFLVGSLPSLEPTGKRTRWWRRT